MSEILIVSPKKKGNTYDVASYLKANNDADMYVIDGGWTPDLRKYRHIVLCSGIYADKVHKLLSEWIKEINIKELTEDTKFHLFLTWFGRCKSDAHAMKDVAKVMEEKGLSFNDSYGSCYGGNFLIRSGHPDGVDFKYAQEWMREQVKE